MKKLMLIVFISLVLILSVINLVGYLVSGSVYKGEVSDHFNGKTFVNPDNVTPRGFRDLVKWGTNREREDWGGYQEFEYGPKPVDRVDTGLVVTFVNHSTFLIQINGLNILTDPIWSTHAGPAKMASPERMRNPGIRFEDLPTIDLVLITHNHYDHLDKHTIKGLLERSQPAFVVPLGVSGTLLNWGATNVKELDWHQLYEEIAGLTIRSTPAQHSSGRGTYDRDRSLWCGYILTVEGRNIYYTGDTGYGRFFKQIGEQYGPFDLSFIPIGAYIPNWFMSSVHISPSEAVEVYYDTQTEKAIAMHFGTFPLADEGRDTPVRDLGAARKEKGLPEDKFAVLTEGQPYRYW